MAAGTLPAAAITADEHQRLRHVAARAKNSATAGTRWRRRARSTGHEPGSMGAADKRGNEIMAAETRMPAGAPAPTDWLQELDDRRQRAELMARAVELLGRQLAQRTIDHHLIGWLYGLAHELQRLLAAATRALGSDGLRERRGDRRAAA
jgi:hypothetical protein